MRFEAGFCASISRNPLSQKQEHRISHRVWVQEGGLGHHWQGGRMGGILAKLRYSKRMHSLSLFPSPQWVFCKQIKIKIVCECDRIVNMTAIPREIHILSHFHLHTKTISFCSKITIDMSALCSMLPVILPWPGLVLLQLLLLLLSLFLFLSLSLPRLHLRAIHCIVCIDTERLSNWQKLTCLWQALSVRPTRYQLAAIKNKVANKYCVADTHTSTSGTIYPHTSSLPALCVGHESGETVLLVSPK